MNTFETHRLLEFDQTDSTRKTPTRGYSRTTKAIMLSLILLFGYVIIHQRNVIKKRQHKAKIRRRNRMVRKLNRIIRRTEEAKSHKKYIEGKVIKPAFKPTPGTPGVNTHIKPGVLGNSAVPLKPPTAPANTHTKPTAPVSPAQPGNTPGKTIINVVKTTPTITLSKPPPAVAKPVIGVAKPGAVTAKPTIGIVKPAIAAPPKPGVNTHNKPTGTTPANPIEITVEFFAHVCDDEACVMEEGDDSLLDTSFEKGFSVAIPSLGMADQRIGGGRDFWAQLKIEKPFTTAELMLTWGGKTKGLKTTVTINSRELTDKDWNTIEIDVFKNFNEDDIVAKVVSVDQGTEAEQHKESDPSWVLGLFGLKDDGNRNTLPSA